MVDKFQEWNDLLDRIQNEQLIPLLSSRNIFRQLEECIGQYEGTQTAAALWWWMTQNYFSAVTTGIRKMAEQKKFRSVSLVILLDEIKQNHRLFTRERFQLFFKNSPGVPADVIARDFDKFSDCSDPLCASAERILEDRTRVVNKCAKAKAFVDKVIAHTERDKSKIPKLRMRNINDAIDELHSAFKKYSLLLRGTSPCFDSVCDADDVRQHLRRIWPGKT